MEILEWSWKSADGLEMYSRGWLPGRKLKAAIVLTHGLGEHVARYDPVGAALAGQGYALLGFDLRGHGRSGGPRGHAPSFESFMSDIDRMLGQVSARYASVPQFIYGHSLGGNLVLNYVLQRRPALAGAIVTAPGLRTALEKQTLKVWLARILGALMPAGILPSGLDASMLSHEREVVERYIHDPLVHDRISFGMARNALVVIDWIFAHAAEFHIPLLLMHGAEDQIAYRRGSEEFAAKVTGDCTLKVWEGMYHEIHNESGREQVLAFMIDWLEKHTPR